MDKFGRSYILEVGTSDSLVSGLNLEVRPPFTIEFDIIRNTLTSANVCQIRIYNLSRKNRNQLRFNISNYGEFRPVVLKAGYGTNLPIIFSGNVSQAWSYREGVNFITQIECYDGGFAFVNSNAVLTFPSGTAWTTVLSTIATQLKPTVDLGAIGDYPGVLGRGAAYSGPPMDLLAELTGGGSFVDLGKLNILNTNEYLADAGGVQFINAKSGLLGTPILEQTKVTFDMIFEPGLQVGQRVFIESLTEENFRDAYKVVGVKHRGMISEAVCGEAITTGEFFYSKILSPAVSHG